MIPKIGIVGDSMIDQYYSVQIKKISPEFPIPVMHSFSDECKFCPGGAANVAYQFLNFNVDARLISFIDEEAENIFKKYKINTDGCLLIKNKIPRKKRFYSDNIPTYRWDVESYLYGLKDINNERQDLYFKNKEQVKELDIIIFSDYNKGIFSKYHDFLSKLINQVNISIVDSKSKHIDKWFGCTIFKPNASEAKEISGKKDPIEAGFWIKSRLKCKYVVITNAEKGVFIIGGENKDDYWIKEIKSLKEMEPAQSVIGAGDCFTSMLAYKLAKNYSIEESVNFAWKAGLKYVKNKFNSPICESDLIDEKYLKDPSILYKRNFKLILANGCFDLFHSGHVDLLKYARSKADKLVVALNSDASVSRIKKDRPILKLEDRIKVLSELECVDFIVSFDEDTPLELINKIRPDILIKGSEYDINQIVGSNIVPETLVFPMIEGISTTSLIERIRK